MRPFVAAIVSLLLFSTVALGQPAIGVELQSDAMPLQNVSFPVAAPAIALARDRVGVAIAWAAQNAKGVEAIHVARLGATGVSGAIVEIPAFAVDAVGASGPSIAASPTGTGFTVAWIELSRSLVLSGERPVFCQLDADLKPSAPRALPPMPAEKIQSTVLVRSGRSTWLASNNSVREIYADGSVGEPLEASAPVSDMAATDGFPQVVAGRRFVTSFECKPFCSHGGWFCPESCRINRYGYSLRFVSLYTASTATTLPFESNAQAAILNDGREIVIAWLHGEQSIGGTVNFARLTTPSFENISHDLQNATVLGTFGPDTGTTRPDLAADGERYVAVWRTTTAAGDHDIAGASIDHDGRVTTFTIASTSADERDPSVIATGGGTFLVAYEKVEGSQRRIAGRYLRFGGRRRAVQ